MPMDEATGTPDELYNLVSLLYHELKQAETCAKFVADAEASHDIELVNFFSECQDVSRDLIERSKALLRARISGMAADDYRRHEEQVEEASRESFPASDAPAY